MTGWLGIDMGGTATRWVWLDAAGDIRRGSAPGATARALQGPEAADFVAALGAVRAALPGPAQGAHLGITGAGFARDPRVAALAAQALGIDPARLSHENDAELAHRAAFGGGPGHLVLAGTGSVALGQTGQGRAVVGGRGVVLDDRGSASWIAAEALREVYARIDATGAPAEAADLAAALGAGDWDATRARVYGDRGGLGLMARQVAAVAVAGCPLAGSILTRAGLELAAMLRQLIARLGPAPVAAVGGVLALDGRIGAALTEAWPEIEFPSPDMALSAALHARTEPR